MTAASRKKPGVAFWATVVVVVAPLLYMLSFGPACWLATTNSMPASAECAAWTIYAPLVRCSLYEKHPPAQALRWWASATGRDGAILLWGYSPDVPLP
jgi:hypothetical protein